MNSGRRGEALRSARVVKPKLALSRAQNFQPSESR